MLLFLITGVVEDRAKSIDEKTRRRYNKTKRSSRHRRILPIPRINSPVHSSSISLCSNLTTLTTKTISSFEWEVVHIQAKDFLRVHNAWSQERVRRSKLMMSGILGDYMRVKLEEHSKDSKTCTCFFPMDDFDRDKYEGALRHYREKFLLKLQSNRAFVKMIQLLIKDI